MYIQVYYSIPLRVCHVYCCFAAVILQIKNIVLLALSRYPRARGTTSSGPPLPHYWRMGLPRQCHVGGSRKSRPHVLNKAGGTPISWAKLARPTPCTRCSTAPVASRPSWPPRAAPCHPPSLRSMQPILCNPGAATFAGNDACAAIANTRAAPTASAPMPSASTPLAAAERPSGRARRQSTSS